MGDWNITALKSQFKAVIANGWLAYFEDAAVKNGFPIEDLLAIASRETNMQNIIGDGGRGFGIMQVDIDTNESFCKSGRGQDPNMAIGMGAAILASKRNQIVKNAGQPIHVKAKSGYEETFQMPVIVGESLRRVTIASYNSGLWAPRNFLKHGDPDRGTTGKDYSQDVIQRSTIFKSLLDNYYDEKMQKEHPNSYGRVRRPVGG